MNARQGAALAGAVITLVLIVLAVIGSATADELGGWAFIVAGFVWLCLAAPLFAGDLIGDAVEAHRAAHPD